MGIDNSYLQSGHTVLLALLLVCAFIELPGFPLTSLPYDVREFLKVRYHSATCSTAAVYVETLEYDGVSTLIMAPYIILEYGVFPPGTNSIK